MSEQRFHQYIIPGLDVLIGDPEFLRPTATTPPKAKMLYIPASYIYRVLDFYKEQSTRGDSARELTYIFGKILDEMNERHVDQYHFDNKMILKFEEVPENPSFIGYRGSHDKYASSKFQAIALAKSMQDRHGAGEVAIMTGSDQLAPPAALNKIDIARVNPDVYTGRITVMIPPEYASLWWTHHRIPLDIWNELFPKQPLVINQYVELMFDDCGQINSYHQNIGRFDGEAVVPLRNHKIPGAAFKRIHPKTAGQAMLFDALLAPVEEVPIVVVSGTFGTGKTFSTVAVALSSVISGQYERIFVCPRDGALGRDIGFLPGDKTSKVLPQAAPILDNLRSVTRLMDVPNNADESETDAKPRSRKGKKSESLNVSLSNAVEQYLEYFEFEPVILMGGRSIEGSFMIYDEFQDMERSQAKTLLARIGDGSKIVILGDPNQTTNPHLNKTSNGLSYSASKLAGNSLAAVITFQGKQEIVRSPAAKAIAECFTNR